MPYALAVCLTVGFSYDGHLAVVNHVSPKNIEDDIIFKPSPALLPMPIVVRFQNLAATGTSLSAAATAIRPARL